MRMHHEGEKKEFFCMFVYVLVLVYVNVEILSTQYLFIGYSLETLDLIIAQ